MALGSPGAALVALMGCPARVSTQSVEWRSEPTVPRPVQTAGLPSATLLAGAAIDGASDERAAALALLAVALGGCATWLWRRACRAEAEAARLATALEAAHRRPALDGEVAQVAHRLANAVAIVKANVGWLARPPEPDEPAGERAEALAEAVSAVERITALTDQLRAAARDAGGGRDEGP